MKNNDSQTISNFKNLSPSNKKLVKDYITLVHNVQSNTEKDIEKKMQSKENA